MPKEKSSVVWNYFNQIDDNQAFCTLCKKNISYRTSTSNLRRHLERKHALPIVVGERDTRSSLQNSPICKKEVKEPSASTSSSSNKGPPRRSAVWNYFSTEDGITAFCKICKKSLTYRSSTTNLKRHIVRKHPNTTINIPIDEVQLSSSENKPKLKQEKITISTPSGTSFFHIVSEEDVANTDNHKQHKVTTFENHGKSRIDNRLLDLFITDFQPFSIVEEAGFQNLVKNLNPTYVLPSIQFITETLLPPLYEKTYSEVQKIIQDVKSVTVTTDCWTSLDAENFVAVTVHFVTENFDMKSVLLECISFTDELNSSGLTEAFKKIIDTWNLENKVLFAVSDNNIEIKKAIKDVKWTHFGCYVHTLNAIIQDGLNVAEPVLAKLRGWVRHFKNYSTEYSQLCDIQRGFEKETKKLIMDSGTRWNSTFYMIERFLEFEEALLTYMTLIESDSASAISTDDWQLFKDIKKILEPMESVTKIMKTKRNINISSIIILTKGLERIYMEIQGRDMTVLAKQIASEFANGIQSHLGDLEKCEKLLVSTFLDPRFKNVGFSNDDVRSTAKRVVECLVSDKITELTSTSSNELTSNEDIEMNNSDGFSLWSHFDQKVAAVQQTDTFLTRAVTEVERYLEDALLERNGNPLAWWREHSYIYPYLAKVAIENLGTVATAIPCERLFSEKGEILCDRRARIESDFVKELVFLNINKF